MRPHGSPKALERRRRRAVALLKQKLSLHEIARRIGCHPSSVLRWRNALRAASPKSVRTRCRVWPGRSGWKKSLRSTSKLPLISRYCSCVKFASGEMSTTSLSAMFKCVTFFSVDNALIFSSNVSLNCNFSSFVNSELFESGCTSEVSGLEPTDINPVFIMN